MLPKKKGLRCPECGRCQMCGGRQDGKNPVSAVFRYLLTGLAAPLLMKMDPEVMSGIWAHFIR